jgi:hypothetical protein
MEYKNDVNSISQPTQHINININNDNNINNISESNDCSYDKFTENLSITIYRYKFTNEFNEELFKFSKIHQYDHRKDFKESWEKWMDENDDLIDGEVRRLSELGYEGDIIDKMFKSARYYFRKKNSEKKDPIKRRAYVGTHKDLLDAIDDHISKNINSGNFKPSEGFDEFCKENIDILKDQVIYLCKAGFTDHNEIKFKIKKTYKNRYFLAISK